MPRSWKIGFFLSGIRIYFYSCRKNLNIADKSTYIRQLLELSLDKEILDFLSQKVAEGEISAWKAAELADISLRKMLKELKKRKIPTYTESMLEEDLQYVLRVE